jgi:WD40 repeat protein
LVSGAAGAGGGEIRLWDAATGERRGNYVGFGGRVLSLAFTADGRTLASGHEDRVVRLWNPATGQEHAVLRGHTLPVWSLAFRRDTLALLSSGSDRPDLLIPGEAKLWSATSAKGEEKD